MKASNSGYTSQAGTLTLPFDNGWALFLDVDGTLLEHISDPGSVQAPAALVTALHTIRRCNGGALALVSGRALSGLDRIFGDTFPAAGQHGLELRSANGHQFRDVEAAPLISAAAMALKRLTAPLTGVLIEDKGLSVTLHYRAAPAARAQLLALAEAVAAPYGADLDLVDGNLAIELRPSRSDKGRAILAFLQWPPFQGRQPVFLGDDRTDEDGFAVVNTLSGHSVKIGGGPTVAAWRMTDPAQVRVWIHAYAAFLEGNPYS